MVESNAKGNIMPAMRYKDAFAAIEWLCEVLGFERRLVVPDGSRGVAHAELTLGNGMIMLGSDREDNHFPVVSPARSETLTQGAYVVVDDIEALYERVLDAGADIVMELEEQNYGGSLFIVRDPEGQLWSLGSYDPWAANHES